MSLTMEERNITPSEAYPGDKTTTKAAEPELLKVEITGGTSLGSALFQGRPGLPFFNFYQGSVSKFFAPHF